MKKTQACVAKVRRSVRAGCVRPPSGSWLHETGGQWRARGAINIQAVFKDLKLDEVNSGLSETEKRPRSEPEGPSARTSLETKRNRQKSLEKSHQ